MKIVMTIGDVHEDGSADAVVDTDEEGTQFLVEYAVIDILTKYAKKEQAKAKRKLKKEGKT